MAPPPLPRASEGGGGIVIKATPAHGPLPARLADGGELYPPPLQLPRQVRARELQIHRR